MKGFILLMIPLTSCVASNVKGGVRRITTSSETVESDSLECNAPKFSDVFVFGDSISDIGNLNSVVPQYPARFTNKKVLVEYVAEKLGFELTFSNHLIALAKNDTSLISGNNYAVAGARSTPMDFPQTDPFDNPNTRVPVQVSAFLLANDGVAPSDALYIVITGGNDLMDIWEEKYIRNNEATTKELKLKMKIPAKSIVRNVIKPLIDAGARHILVSDSWDIGATPKLSLNQPKRHSKFGNRLTRAFNRYLENKVRRLECNYNVNIMHFQDTFETAWAADLDQETPCNISVGIDLANPPIVGPMVYDSKCYETLPNFEKNIWWDEFHPTSIAHNHYGNEILENICKNAGKLGVEKKRKTWRGKKC